MAPLTEADRRSILDKVLDTVDKKFMGPEPNVTALRQQHEGAVLQSATTEQMEQAVTALLKDLGTSHTGCFHESKPRAAGRIAIAATFTKAETTDGTRWLFQDVHPGGVAAGAGIRPGDVLLTIDGQEFRPPQAMPFALAQTYTFEIRKADGTTARTTLTVPGSKEKQRPIVVPDQVVTASKVDGVGVIRVSMFPGTLGMDVARDMSRAVAELQCSRLIFDLRGNTGGGMGCLRLMSHLCADRRGVGYSVGRSVAKKGYRKEQLPAFDHIPSSKWGVLPLAVKFAAAGRSVAVFTEALGVQPHHGHVAVLINEHSASAAEMIAGFASESGLATLVGVKTAGRLVGTSAFKVGFGFRIVIPVATYYTWQGHNLEGTGVTPKVEEPLSPEALWHGRDNQLERALDVLR
ncbi:MAG: S41 family peptidase [Vicinamibacterales bacterium]